MVEVVAASVIGALMAGGTLMAFVTAIRISQRAGGSPGTVLLLSYADQLSNLSDCNNDSATGGWFSTTPCTLKLPGGNQTQPACDEADASCNYMVEPYAGDVGPPCTRGSDHCIHAKIAVELTQPPPTQ